MGWIGSVFCYLALGLAAVTTSDVETMRAAWVGMEVIGWFVIVPLGVTSLLTGLVISLGTKWGLFRYYWVVISVVLTSFAVIILLLHMPTVSVSAGIARRADRATLESLGADLFHPGVGLVVLLTVQVLNIYKPQGMTKYGWRKQQGRGA